MKTLLTATGLTLALSLAAGVSTGAEPGSLQHEDHKKFDKGSSVTLQGCVVEAEKKDTFVLNHVREWPIAATDMGRHGKRMYWIEKTDKLKGHVGHTIQITGKITDVAKSEMEFKDGGFKVEIEGPGRDVVTPASNAGVNPATRPNQDDIPITLLKLKIDELKMVSSTCTSTL